MTGFSHAKMKTQGTQTEKIKEDSLSQFKQIRQETIKLKLPNGSKAANGYYVDHRYWPEKDKTHMLFGCVNDPSHYEYQRAVDLQEEESCL